MTDPTLCSNDKNASLPQEEQIVTVTIRTRGEACELTDNEIKEWYRVAVEKLLDPNIGAHEVSVSVARRPIG